MGCYRSQQAYPFASKSEDPDPSMTVDKCISICHKLEKTYAALKVQG